MNRVIRSWDLDAIYVIGPGTGAPRSSRTRTSREPTARSTRPSRATQMACDSCSGSSRSRRDPQPRGAGDARLHSTRAGSWATPSCHAYGARSTTRISSSGCVVGDGEAETGPLATSWHSNKFLDPVRDGAVLPILHLNGYKIANPTVLARIRRTSCEPSWRGYGHRPVLRRRRRSGPHAPADGGPRWTARSPRSRTSSARLAPGSHESRPRWPMIVAAAARRAWTGPKEVDGLPSEGSWRSHQSRSGRFARTPSTSRSSRPGSGATGRRSCSTPTGRSSRSSRAAPRSYRRMSRQSARERRIAAARPRAARLPRLRRVDVPAPGATTAEATRVLARFSATSSTGTRDLPDFGPDETSSNRLGAVFRGDDRQFDAELLPTERGRGA